MKKNNAGGIFEMKGMGNAPRKSRSKGRVSSVNHIVPSSGVSYGISGSNAGGSQYDKDMAKFTGSNKGGAKTSASFWKKVI